jgi:hypothetical protein
MKPMKRLVALVLVLLASLTALPSAAQVVVLWPKTCPELCAIILCAYPQTCGTFVDSTGVQRCGCHDRSIKG